MPAGRPTLYRAEYCERVIAWGTRGKSREWMCAELDIVPNTLANWEAEHPEFLIATTRALTKSQQYWEDLGHDNLVTQGYQATMWGKNMTCRFPAQWREKSESAVTHNVGQGFAELIGLLDGKTRSIDE
jgi:hypothetical protein